MIEERGYGDIISILGILQKENPLGSAPPFTSHDPQFNNWQQAINTWVNQNPLPAPINPVEFDDNHTPEKQPHIIFISPDKDTVSTQELSEIAANITSYFPLQEIQLFLNDGLVDSKTAPIYQGRIAFSLPDALDPGTLRIKIIAYDGLKNKAVAEKIITVAAPEQ